MYFIIGFIIASIVLVWYILQPVMAKVRRSVNVDELQQEGLENLLLKKEMIYAEIKDLDFEHDMGRITEEDFVRLRGQFKSQAEHLLEQIDLLNHPEEREAWIEKEVQARRKNGRHVQVANVKCKKCGTPAVPGNRFCARCGGQLL